MLTQQTAILPAQATKARTAAWVPALMAMMLSFFIIGMVGFSNLDVVHNAAHDTRHSNAFPCH